MSRWYVEKNGTGIEKSGTGIEKSGSGIEKSGTGIEKSGSGIEKSGTGIRKGILACSLFAISFISNVNAIERLNPTGALQVVVDNETIAVSWIIDGSVFSGVAPLAGSVSNVVLTEVGLVSKNASLLVAGSGTGTDVARESARTEVAGSGTGIEVAGSGTGIEIAGSGTGTDVAGSGTGLEIAGAGTGTDIAGSGTGNESHDYATDPRILVAGSGTGSDSISITLPAGTGLQMEVSLRCDTASVSVLDAGFAEVVTFENVPVIGATGLCANDSHGKFDANRLQGAAKDGLD